MTKKEIVKTISEEIGSTQLKTKEIVQKTFDAIVETLVADGRIELRNFGVFEVKKRAARKARNPRTGQRVNVPEKYVVTFKPGKEMEERVRLLSERKAAQAAAEAAGAGSAPLARQETSPAPMGSQRTGVSPASQAMPPSGGGTTGPQTSSSPTQSFGVGQQYGGDSQYRADSDRPA